jgi:peptide/nickel transport system permease protein
MVGPPILSGPATSTDATSEAAPESRAPAAGPLLTLWRVMRANPLTLVGFLMVVLIGLTALYVEAVPVITGLLGHSITGLPYPIFAPLYAPNSPPSPSHWFGTDSIGQDIFSVVVAATPLDLGIAFGVAGASLIGGGALGLVTGYYDRPGTIGGVLATVVLRLTDIFLAFPSLVLALAVAEALGRGTGAAIVAVLVTWWPYYVRLARGEVLSIRDQPYIMAARAAGVRDRVILIRHVLRNIAEPLVVYFTLDVGTVLITFSTISFLAIGTPYGVPEWGNLVQYYSNLNFPVDPWDVLFPGLAIFVTVLSFSLLGDGLRDILDPRSRRILAQPAARTPPTPPSAGGP